MILYTDNDPKVCGWAREIVRAGLVPAGEVVCRSIKEWTPDELRPYTQVHHFAGILGWPYALKLAGWPADRPVWTASCPCQPFSSAGKQLGVKDPRHLWPVLRCLVGRRRPAIVFGEQVASADGRAWLAGVRADLARLGYAVGAADLCAAGVGAPHIRQRLWWVAELAIEQRERVPRGRSGLPAYLSMEVDSEQQGLPVPQHNKRQAHASSAAGDGGAGPGGGPHQQEPARLPAFQSAHRDGIGEQSQPGAQVGRRDEAQGPNAVASLPVDRRQVPMAWVVSDEGSRDRGEGEGFVGSWDCDEPDASGLAHSERGAVRLPRPGTHGAAASGSEGSDGERQWVRPDAGAVDGAGGLGDADDAGPQGRGLLGRERAGECPVGPPGFWDGAVSIECGDGKTRRIKRGIAPLATGVSGRLAVVRPVIGSDPPAQETHWYSRVAALKGLGNSIVPQVAAEFIMSYMDSPSPLATKEHDDA